MKYFCYTHATNTPKTKRGDVGHMIHTVMVYRIVRGVPRLVGTKSETFTSDLQLVMDILEEHKQLPPEAFTRLPLTGGRAFYYPDQLHKAGHARITRVG